MYNFQAKKWKKSDIEEQKEKYQVLSPHHASNSRLYGSLSIFIGSSQSLEDYLNVCDVVGQERGSNLQSEKKGTLNGL